MLKEKEIEWLVRFWIAEIQIASRITHDDTY